MESMRLLCSTFKWNAISHAQLTPSLCALILFRMTKNTTGTDPDAPAF
jgi:hypothetical protein